MAFRACFANVKVAFHLSAARVSRVSSVSGAGFAKGFGQKIMSPTQNSVPNSQGEPLQIGIKPGEVESLIEEIGQSGVASSPEQVESQDVLERDHDGNREGQIQMPIITSD